VNCDTGLAIFGSMRGRTFLHGMGVLAQVHMLMIKPLLIAR
jgi:hypothetical protein